MIKRVRGIVKLRFCDKTIAEDQIDAVNDLMMQVSMGQFTVLTFAVNGYKRRLFTVLFSRASHPLEHTSN